MVRKLNLSFPVASDQTKKIVSQFRLVDKKKGKTKTATVLIDTKGKIRWLQIGKRASDHPAAPEILDRLEKIS